MMGTFSQEMGVVQILEKKLGIIASLPIDPPYVLSATRLVTTATESQHLIVCLASRASKELILQDANASTASILIAISALLRIQVSVQVAY